MKEVNADLYDFLSRNETGVDFNPTNNEVNVYVHVRYFELDDFLKIIGERRLIDGDLKATLYDNTICIDVTCVIEENCHKISSYQNCFFEDDWDRCKEEIMAMES